MQAADLVRPQVDFRLAEEQLAILKGQIWIARVNLHLALGGDWGAKPPEKQVAKKES